MAYVQSQKNNQRLITMGAVAALHVVAGYALVSGLAVKFVEQTRDIFEARNVPDVVIDLPKIPPPPPKDRVDQFERDVIKPTPSAIDLGGSEIGRLPDLTEILPPKDLDLSPRDLPPRFTPEMAKPRNAPGSWAGEADYPSRAIREGREGVTKFALTIDSTGRVARCDIVGSSGHADLDAKTCELVAKRARFEPARDGNGEKTTGTFSSSIRWQIPD